MMFQRKIETRQIPLDLGFRQAFGRGDFHIGSSNKDAVGWIDKWPDWPAPVFILHGPAASGKSHLAAVWRNTSAAIFIKPEQLVSQSAEELYGLGDAFVIDGLDPWLGERKAEETLFHLYNMLKEQGGSLMVTMRMAASRADFIIPDLASRFRAAPSASIHPPDDFLLGSVMIKLLSDRQLTATQDVIAYLIPRMERSFAAARDIVDYADRLALAEKKPISVPLMRKVLNDLQED
jgi:chromosomal replication initiation ATPase DnaA